ncbi:MAG: PAS domain S-box protein [Alphaproteobacteria bacterium]
MEQEGADLFRAMVDGAPVALWMTDASGHSTFHNRAWLDFTGRDRDELDGSAWVESLHPDDCQRCLDLYRGAFRERRNFQMEYRLRRNDGKYRWVLDKGAPYYADDGTFRGFVGANVDITERKEAEALATRFGRVVESSHSEIYLFDAATLQFVHVNYGARNNLGYSMDEMRTMTPLDLKPEMTRESFAALVEPLRNGETDQVRFETFHRRKDGSLYPVEVWLQLSRAEDAPVFIAMISDITKWRETEAFLKGRNLVLERISTGAPLSEILPLITQTAERAKPGLLCSILLLEKETGRLRLGAAPSFPAFYNAAIDGLAIGPRAGSCGTAAFTGKRVIAEDITIHPYWGAFRELAGKVGIRACWSEPIRSSTGEILGTFALYYREVRAPDDSDLDFINRLAQIASIAIERQRHEDESGAARKQAELANRTKSEFLANMSHELRSPLNSVLGFAELMKNELFGPMGSPRYREYAEDIYQSASHLLAVINDILDISKIEAGKLELYEEDVDLAEVIEICIRLMATRAMEAEVTLETDLPLGLPGLHADSRKVKQVLLNLLSNSVKFTPKGGRVTTSAKLTERGELRLAVADTGIGIAPENIEKALSPFAQIDSSLSRKYEGTGLGLPLSKALVELHGGRLEIQTALGVGTTVAITFPPERVLVHHKHSVARGT